MRFGSYEPRTTYSALSRPPVQRTPLRGTGASSSASVTSPPAGTAAVSPQPVGQGTPSQRRGAPNSSLLSFGGANDASPAQNASAAFGRKHSATADHLGRDLVTNEELPARHGRARGAFTPQKNESMSGTLASVVDGTGLQRKPSGVKRQPHTSTANASSLNNMFCAPPAAPRPRPRMEAPPFALDYPSARKKAPIPRTRKMFEGRTATAESDFIPSKERKKTFPEKINSETEQPPIRPQPGSRVRPSTADLLRFKTPRAKTPRAALQKKLNNILAWGATPRVPQQAPPQPAASGAGRTRAKPAPAPYDTSSAATMFAPPSARRKLVHRTVQPTSNLTTGLIPKSARGASSSFSAGAKFVPRPRLAQQSSLGLGSFVPKSARGGQNGAAPPAGRSRHVDPGSGVKAALQGAA